MRIAELDALRLRRCERRLGGAPPCSAQRPDRPDDRRPPRQGRQAPGDGLIVELRSVVDAVRCAVEVQRAMVESNARLDDSPAEFELALCLNPNFVFAQAYYGLTLSYCARWREAALAAGRALRLSRAIHFWRS